MTAALVVVGEAVVDLIGASDQTFHAIPGGSPLNVAVSAARLGTPTYFAGRFARDRFATLLKRHASDHGVNLGLAVDAPLASTALAVASVDEHGDADYAFYLDAAPDWSWEPDSLPMLPPEAAIVHVGSLVAALEPGASTVLAYCEELRRANRVLVSYDANVRPAMVSDRDGTAKRVERFAGVAHIAKASADDLAWLWPSRSPDDIAQGWLASGAGCVVVTLGAGGADVVTSGGTLHVRSVHVDVVDTVGAGDAFTAAFLSTLATAADVLDSWDGLCAAPPDLAFGRAADRAAAASALTCAQAGALGPRANEVDELMRKEGRTRT